MLCGAINNPASLTNIIKNKASETYQEYMDRFIYCENEPTEEFCLYLAKEIMEKGNLDTAMHFYEFQEYIGWDKGVNKK